MIVVLLLLVSASGVSIAQPSAAPPVNGCGEVMTIETHDRATTRYTLARAQGAPAQDARIALVLLVGGGGNINLDDKGCPQSLSRNVPMRIRPLFHGEGFVTALVDAPSDLSGGDGLAGFRVAPQHADDLGKVIADVRTRTNGSFWLVGHSRGTISAANAAARLSGPVAPDGLVLMSAMMSGDARAEGLGDADRVRSAAGSDQGAGTDCRPCRRQLRALPGGTHGERHGEDPGRA